MIYPKPFFAAAYCKSPLTSFRRRPGSSSPDESWTPGPGLKPAGRSFAGVTKLKRSARGSMGLMIALLACFFCGLLLTPRWSRAELRIQPDITVEEEYTSNFFRSEIHPTAAWITRVSPGVKVEAVTERSRLDLNYHFNYYWYHGVNAITDLSRLNYPGQDLNVFAETQLSSKLRFGVDENFILTREPAYSDAFSLIREPDKYERNRVLPVLTYDIAEKGEVKLGYRNEIFNYLQHTDPSHEDSTENRGLLTLTYHLNSTNHLDLQNQYWQRNYQGGVNSDYNSFQSMLIFRREFSSTLSGHVAAGAQYREFMQSSLANTTIFAFSLGLMGQTEKSKVYASVEHNLNDFTVGDQYFDSWLLRASGEHIFWGRVRAFVGGFYQLANFLDSPRKDSYWNTSIGVGYLFWDQRLELSVEYDYFNRNSNEPGYSYTENQVYFRISIRHDLGK